MNEWGPEWFERPATDKQWAYVRSLLDEAFVHHYETGMRLDRHHRPSRYTIAQANSDIDTLKGAKLSGWGSR